jgi:hypothetical protein
MPWKQTERGKECPRGKFIVNGSTRGDYREQKEKCGGCPFGNMSEGTLEDCCECPPTMSEAEYKKMYKEYCAATRDINRSPHDFRLYVQLHYQAPIPVSPPFPGPKERPHA